MNHPLCEVTTTGLFDPVLSAMSNLMQVVLIEGFDLELIQVTAWFAMNSAAACKQILG